MPYSDPEKQKAAKREWARKRRAEKKRKKLLNEKIRSEPSYKALSPEKQKEYDVVFLKTLENIDDIFIQKMEEMEQSTKIRIDQWAEQTLTNIKKLVELSHSQKQNETPTIKEKNK